MKADKPRTKAEQIEYFEWLQFEYEKIAARTDDEDERIRAEAKADAYHIAAFELKHNME